MTGADALPEWKVSLLTVMTIAVVLAAHWHSFRAARADLRAAKPERAWRRVLIYLLRHELHYLRQVPLLVFYVVASVFVVARL